jgi:type IV pilus assembly protein PilB
MDEPDTIRRHRGQPLGQILKAMELVTEGHIQEALQIQRKLGGLLGEVLIRLGYVAPEEVLLALAAQMGMEVVDLDRTQVDPAALARVSATVARSYNIVPVKFEHGILTVAISHPRDLNALDDLRGLLRCTAWAVLVAEDAIPRALEKYYGGGAAGGTSTQSP